MVNTDGVTGPFIQTSFVEHYEQQGDMQTAAKIRDSQAAVRRLVEEAKHLAPFYSYNYPYPSDLKTSNRQLRFYREQNDSLIIKICILGTLENGKEIGELSQENISVETPSQAGSGIGSLAIGIFNYLMGYSSNPVVKFSSFDAKEQKKILADFSNRKIEVVSSKSDSRPFEIVSSILIKPK